MWIVWLADNWHEKSNFIFKLEIFHEIYKKKWILECHLLLLWKALYGLATDFNSLHAG